MEYSISGSVGIAGINRTSGISIIQRALNPSIPDAKDSSLSPNPSSSNTVQARIHFQKNKVQMVNPDGRADLSGKTIMGFCSKKLALLLFTIVFLFACAPASNKIKNIQSIHVTAAEAPVLIMPIDLQIASQLASGRFKVNKEWTSNAINTIRTTILEKLNRKGVNYIDYTEENLDDNNFFKINKLVTLSATNAQFFPLPSRADGQLWTVGEPAQKLINKTGAKYALYLYFRDSYVTAGRAALTALIIVGSGGYVVPVSQPKVGTLTLVDLESGDIVWYERIYSGARDMRETTAVIDAADLWFKNIPLLNDK